MRPHDSRPRLEYIYVYIYIYIYISEVGGKEALAGPNREIGFGSVSCSCRACVRAGEAKLRERVRDDDFSTLVAILARFSAAPVTPLDFGRTVSDDSLQGFKENVAFWDDSLQGRKKIIDLLYDSLQGFKETV